MRRSFLVMLALCVAVSAAWLMGIPAAALGSSSQTQVRPRSEAVVIEFEALAPSAAASGGDPVVQPMAGFGSGWGGDAQLFWRPPAPVEAPARNYPYISLLFDVPAAGDYELTLQYTLAPDYGQFTVLVAGRKAADVDGYGGQVQVARRSLGRHHLDAGANQITFSVVGKAIASTGFIVGLDRLEATPAIGGAAAPGAAPTPARRPPGRTAEAGTEPIPSTTVMRPGEGPSAVAADSVRATHLIGENDRPRLEARSWPRQGRGSGATYESRRVRLDWDRADLRLQMRWLDPAGAPGGRWQLYTDIPPPRGTAQPIASGELPAIAAGQWQIFERDLEPHRPVDPVAALRDAGRLGSFEPGKMRPQLFLQVQPTNANGLPVGQPSNFIEVKFTSEPMGTLKDPEPVLTLALVDFTPVRPYDQRFLCWAVATVDGPVSPFLGEPMFNKGDKRSDLCDHESSSFLGGFVDAIADAFGSFLDFVGSGIDQVSQFYADLKEGVVDIVAAPLASVGCSICRDALELGLDAALASAGVPPSLPNFDDVVKSLEDGSIDAITDVLVDNAVSQGLPVNEIPFAQDAAREAVEHLVAEAKSAALAPQAGGAGGWEPDLSRAYSPAVVVFEVKNQGPVASRPMNLQLVHQDPEEVEFEILPARLLSPRQVIRLGGYAPAWLQVPSLAPGTSMRVAVTLTPTADPHLWLDLIYGRSSLLPPQEWCDRDYGARASSPDPAELEACQARMKVLFDLQFVSPYALNRAWGEAYGAGPDRLRIVLFRFGDMGNEEGLEATLTADPGGAAWVEYPRPTWLGRRVDQCIGGGQTCGEAAAEAFCKRLGYPLAVGAQGAANVGPTVRLDDGTFCNGPECAGFASVTCSKTRE